MAGIDMFDLFGAEDGEQLSMDAFFGGFSEEKKPGKGGSKAASTKPVTTTETDLDSDEEELEDESVSTSDEKEKKPATPAKKKSSTLTGASKVKLPCTVYGRNFRMEVTTLTDATVNGLVKAIYEAGYKEVASSKVDLAKVGDAYFVCSPTSESGSDELIQGLSTTAVTVCDGMLQAELGLAQFPGKDADEISISDVVDAWGSINGEYRDTCGLAYDAKAAVAIPVVYSEVKRKDIKLPCRVRVCGTWQEVTTESCGIITDALSQEELTTVLFFEGAPVHYKPWGDGYIAEFSAASSKTIHDIKRDGFVKLADAKASAKAVEKYVLPLEVYFATIGQTVRLTSEQFGGKEKVEQKEVLDLMKASYQILRNKDRSIQCEYCKEANILSIAATSGKKGAYALPESEGCGFFH